MRIGKSRSKIFLIVLVLTGVVSLLWITTSVPFFANVHRSYRPSDIWVVDHDGNPLESIRSRSERRSLEWVEWHQISPAFRDLLVQVEDQRFYSHRGVDFLAVMKALWDRSSGRSYRGASTLTMQLVGLLDKSPHATRRTFVQKMSQIFYALKLESKWSKEEILEAYVNLVSVRGEVIGLRAASLGYFRKLPSGLLPEEAAILIALLRAPNAAPELVAKRACTILKQTDCGPVHSLTLETVARPYQIPRARELIPVLSRSFVEEGWTSSVIHTSLDQSIQTLSMRALHEQLRLLRTQNVHDGAVLVLETQTGRVVAYAANGGAAMASAEQVDGIQMRRQAGSTIKPFVYATAFDRKILKPESLLEDSPADLSVSGGRVYHPKNYDYIFRGYVSAGEALGSSMNVPTVRALGLIGETAVLDRLHALDFQKLETDDYYGPSLALGAVDVSLWELTHAYRQFALPGKIFSDETRENIFNILAAPEYRRFTFGMDSILALPFTAAVKTGTSKDMRDNWCIGWTSKYTIGVWVGNFDGAPMWNVSGMSGAAPIWRSLMLALHPNPTGALATYVPPALPLLKHSLTRIRYPATDMLVGLDPDIPMSLQKLPFEIDNPQKGHQLFLNHHLVGKAEEIILWPLKRGKFLAELKTPTGNLVDAIRFEVR